MTNELPTEPPFVVVDGNGTDGTDSQTVGYLVPPGSEPVIDDPSVGEAIQRPAKVMRIGSMIKQLLEEVRQMELDSASRLRLREIYERSVRELAETLSPDLAAELDRIALFFGDVEPTDAELRIAQAQLVGWLEGLFQGIQATLFAQQMAAQAQLEQMRKRGLPPGAPDGRPSSDGTSGPRIPGGGAYL
jgi:hypothetical protein